MLSEANGCHPGYLGLFGVFRESPTTWEVLPSRLARSCLRSFSAQDYAGPRLWPQQSEGTFPGPKWQQLWPQFPD